MRIRVSSVVVTALAIVTLSCTDGALVAPSLVAVPDRMAVVLPPVRISEIHYDNAGTDAGEAIEVSGPAGTDLTGWTLVLYNGSPASRSTYGTTTLSGTIPATCGARGVTVSNYPANGLQNGGSGSTEPDGVALVNASGTVVEFLSYEGSFVAANGPAMGMTSTNIGVFEGGSDAVGMSLKRNGADVWSAASASNFGACNDQDQPPAAVVASVGVTPAAASVVQGASQQFTATAFDAGNQPIPGATLTWSVSDAALASVSTSGLATGAAPGDVQIIARAANGVSGSATLTVTSGSGPLADVRISELHYDNAGTDVNEMVEVIGPAGTNLAGWTVVLYNGNGGAAYGTLALSGTLADQCGGKGVATVAGPAGGIQNGNPDGLALVGPSGQVVEFLSYGGVFVAVGGAANGLTSTDILRTESGVPIGQSLQRNADLTWRAPSTASFGSCNPDTPPPPPRTITFSGRTSSDPALPVGFQDQLFATLRESGVAVPGTVFAWTSDTPALASVDQSGVVTALGAGTAVIRATTPDGTTNTWSLGTRIATAGTTAQYAGNAEFGEPADGDASDDLIVRRAQLVSSFNPVRGIPNWVSYNIDATHFGNEDRCDCFTFDPALPASVPRYTTADYTGAAAINGFSIDRGHLARSFDRTAGSLDNATTFYFTNIIPQASDNNQGPWAALEMYLGNLAISQNREVYVITGASGNRGTVKNEGRIVIPTVTWKVAVIMPRDQGLAQVDSWDDVQVIAVLMPNEPGVRDVPWGSYRTTVDLVEVVSGYDLLARLRDDIEIAVESNTRPPTAVAGGPYAGAEGATITMSGAGSSDPDAGQSLSFVWSFGDGASGAGSTTSHAYAQDGAYTVRLIVTDPLGLADTTTATVTVANVAPAIAPFAGATLLPGETYEASGSFTDPGADSWEATVDYGDGTGVADLALSGTAFTLSHRYGRAGTFEVTVRVRDDDVTSTRTQTVVVLAPAEGVSRASELVDDLVAAGMLSAGEGTSLTAKLRNAERLLQRDDATPAVQLLEAALNELDALERSGRLTMTEAAPLRVMIERVLASVRS